MSKQRNSDNAPVTNDFSIQASKTMTFDGGTTNDPGDFDGTGNPADLFTVTGTVKVRLLARCTTLLTGASATVEVGTAATTAGLIAQTTGTNIDANEIWHDATPDASVELSSVLTEKIVSDNIIQTVATANVTAGVIEYTCFWFPLSEDGNVVAA
ncbi:MAG: hypothetical protein ACXABY_20800 [Candidatus Thorarchaeota archaeon]|jgi:hypothetical protein